jgi:hypothetical protein
MSKKVILPLFPEKLHLIISMLQMANFLKRGFLDTLFTPGCVYSDDGKLQ